MKNSIIIAFLILIAVGCGKKESSSNINVVPWANGEVYYTFSDEVSSAHVEKIESVLNSIEDNTDNIYFIKSDRSDAVVFGYSDVMFESRATLGYTKDNFANLHSTSRRIIYHEVFHVLGMVHEHQRYDRDEHVTINYCNMDDCVMGDFNMKAQLYNIDEFNYELGSIMHYTLDCHSNNGELTIEPHTGNDYVPASKPTTLDYQKLNAIYN